MGYKKIGIASCVVTVRETSITLPAFKAHGIRVLHGRRKVGARDKTEIGVPNKEKAQRRLRTRESMCNPIHQAKTLAAHGCDFNIVIGLCVGRPPVHTPQQRFRRRVMIVKDRVLQRQSSRGTV